MSNPWRNGFRRNMLYEYRCEQGHVFQRVLHVRDHTPLAVCDCGLMGVQVIAAPLLVTAQPECRYDSPIDGTPITTWAQRDWDLKRSGCRPYDEGMKQDYERQQVESERALDAAIDETVERRVEQMSTAQRGKLWSEVTEQGKTLTYDRTPT